MRKQYELLLPGLCADCRTFVPSPNWYLLKHSQDKLPQQGHLSTKCWEWAGKDLTECSKHSYPVRKKKQADPSGDNTAAASIKGLKINLEDTILYPSA